MNVGDEISLFRRYLDILDKEERALHAITSVHLAQQLERYISRSLDLGWIIICILDINSDNLFSCVRDDSHAVDNTKHPEYQYAVFLTKLCTLMLAEAKNVKLDEEEAYRHKLNTDAQFYFGKTLTEVNNSLLELVTEQKAVSPGGVL